MAETLRFLRDLFGMKPDNFWLYLWEVATKRSSWFQSIEAAAAAGEGRQNVYVGCCLADQDYGPTKRCTAANAAAMPGVWCDIDFADGKAHKTKSLPFPPDADAAMKIIDAYGTPPTVVVHSGHGLQAWWLFEELVVFRDAEHRQEFARRSQRFQDELVAIGKSLGWHVDSVGDLARVLRLPGTINAKTEPHVPCAVYRNGGPRVADLSTFRSQAVIGGELDFNPERNTPVGKTANEWSEVISKGAPEGKRNTDAASLIGKILSMLTDPFDNDSIGVQWQLVVAWNARNKPPLDETELRSIFNSIVRSERSQRSERDHADAFKRLDQAATSAAWRLMIVDSRPPVYRLYSPHWSGDAVLTVEQYLSWGKMRVCIAEQKCVGLPKELGKAWEKAPKNGEALFVRLLREAEHVKASAEESDDSRLAAMILDALEAGQRNSDELTDDIQRGPVRLPDGTVAFAFRQMVMRMNAVATGRINERDVARLLARVGIGTSRGKEGRLRARLATTKAVKKLQDLASDDRDDLP